MNDSEEGALNPVDFMTLFSISHSDTAEKSESCIFDLSDVSLQVIIKVSEPIASLKLRFPEDPPE